MPNWCSNSIIIEGPTDKIRVLWESAQAQEDGALLEAMVPIGEWDYGRAVESWGTKWDISLEDLQLIDNGDGTSAIQGWADSAWSPPIEAFATYCGNNDDVTAEIRYFEPGMSFIGIWTAEEGEQTWDDVGSKLNINADNDDDAVLFELMEEFNVWDWYDFDEDEE